MKAFLSGKTNKVVALLLLFFLPRIIGDTFFEYDYEISSIIGIIAIAMFMFYVNKPAVIRQKNCVKESKMIVFAAAVTFAITLQFMFLCLSYRMNTLTAESNWLTYKRIVDLIILAPISEELFMRWSLVETCISKDTKKYKKIIFLVMALALWNFCHGLDTINITIILLGCIFYIIYFKSKNLLYCIVLHMSLNTMNFILTSPLQNKLTFLCKSNIFLAVDIMLIILSFCMIIINISKNKHQKADYILD